MLIPFVASTASQHFDVGKVLCYIDLDTETFLPVTRRNICEHKTTVTEHFWNYIHNRLIRYTHSALHPSELFEEGGVRLGLDDGKRRWFVDSAGNISAQGRAGRLPPPVRRRIVKELLNRGPR